MKNKIHDLVLKTLSSSLISLEISNLEITCIVCLGYYFL